MAMTLSQYRSPTVFPNETEYNNAMKEAYQSGQSVKSSYQHGMNSGDENARLQELYARHKQLENKKNDIVTRINEIKSHLSQTKEYMNDPLYRTAREKYIWTNDDSGLVSYRKMQDDLRRTKAQEEETKRIKSQAEESTKITLRNKADRAQNIIDTLQKTPENAPSLYNAQMELDESLEQLRNVGEEYTPKKYGDMKTPKEQDVEKEVQRLDTIEAKIDALVDGKFTESERKEIMDELEKRDSDDAKVIDLKSKLEKKKSKEKLSDEIKKAKEKEKKTANGNISKRLVEYKALKRYKTNPFVGKYYKVSEDNKLVEVK